MKQPMTELAGRTIYLGGMNPEKFLPVLNAFGPLPGEGQDELAQRLVEKIGLYRLEYEMERPQPAVERKRLEDIAKATERLLALLGIEDPKVRSAEISTAQPRSGAASWLLPELHTVATERRPTRATLDANQRWSGLLLLLSDLMEAAKRCAPSASQLVLREHEGRGGNRRDGPSPKGRLLHTVSRKVRE
jgi:hypothetical protein